MLIGVIIFIVMVVWTIKHRCDVFEFAVNIITAIIVSYLFAALTSAVYCEMGHGFEYEKTEIPITSMETSYTPEYLIVYTTDKIYIVGSDKVEYGDRKVLIRETKSAETTWSKLMAYPAMWTEDLVSYKIIVNIDEQDGGQK